MRPQQPQQQQSTQKTGCNPLTAWFLGIGYSVEVLLHDDIGERRVRDMGLPLGIALIGTTLLAFLLAAPVTPPLIMPLVPYDDPTLSMLDPAPTLPADPLQAPDDASITSPWPVVWFALLAFVAHNRQRLLAFRRRQRGGPILHSYYGGRPHLLRLLPH